MSRIKTILVPTDFSDGALHAARYAMAFAKELGASVTLLHAWVPPVYPRPPGAAFAPTQSVVDETEHAVSADLDRHRQLLADPAVPLSTKKMLGTDAGTIVQVAVEGGFDLIIMGTHGRTGWRHLLLGSIAEEVVRTSEVPVLTVREPKKA